MCRLYRHRLPPDPAVAARFSSFSLLQWRGVESWDESGSWRPVDHAGGSRGATHIYQGSFHSSSIKSEIFNIKAVQAAEKRLHDPGPIRAANVKAGISLPDRKSVV